MNAPLLAVRDWRTLASCRDTEPDLFFPVAVPGTEAERRQAAQAIAFCTGCVVRPECLSFALETSATEGVWGGTTADERTAVRLDLTGGAA